jgi:hypothetical protein
MINLIPYDGDCVDYHKAVVAKKNRRASDPTYKERLEALDDEIQRLFQRYSDLVSEDDLKSITPFGFTDQAKSDLLSLYRYKSQLLQGLSVQLTTTENGRKFNTCQMCTVEPIGSFDHMVPKEQFPEFVVNPINLFPCCTTCNGKKGVQWIDEGERAFLNLYYDILPDFQYLKVHFSTYPLPHFSIDETRLTPDFASLLKSHYEKLDLFGRFVRNSSEIIDPLVTDAKRIVPIIGIDEYRKTVLDSTTEMQSIYGKNHWKSLLKRAVSDHVDFESLIS